MPNAAKILILAGSQESRDRLGGSLTGNWKVSSRVVNGSHQLASIKAVQLTEPLDGPDATFVREIVDNRPAAILIDSDSTNVPWLSLIHILKTSAATRRIPILAIGESTGSLAKAQQYGADRCFHLTQWLAGGEKLLTTLAERSTIHGLDRACAGRLHPSASKGIRAINDGKYFEAHEWLEKAWMAVDVAEGSLYRALLQVAVAYLHLQRRNLKGAKKMLLRMRQWLDPLPDHCRGIDINKLKLNLRRLQQLLDQLPLDHTAKIDQRWFQPIPKADAPAQENASPNQM